MFFKESTCLQLHLWLYICQKNICQDQICAFTSFVILNKFNKNMTNKNLPKLHNGPSGPHVVVLASGSGMNSICIIVCVHMLMQSSVRAHTCQGADMLDVRAPWSSCASMSISYLQIYPPFSYIKHFDRNSLTVSWRTVPFGRHV